MADEQAQQKTIEFLSTDHGEAVTYSLADNHPLAQELEVVHGDIMVRFSECLFLVKRDGGFTPLPLSPVVH